MIHLLYGLPKSAVADFAAALTGLLTQLPCQAFSSQQSSPVSQMGRLQVLLKHAKAHRLPVGASAADSDSDDEAGVGGVGGDNKLVGVKAAHERLKSIQELYGLSPGRSPTGLLTPNR